MLYNHLILCHPLLLLSSTFPSIRIFFQWVISSNVGAYHIRKSESQISGTVHWKMKVVYLGLSNIRTRRYKLNTWAWAGSSDPHGTQHCSTSDPSLAHILSCVWLCDSVDCSPPGSSAHGIFQARILEQVAIFFSRGSSSHRDWTHVLISPALTGRFFTHWVIGESQQQRTAINQED